MLIIKKYQDGRMFSDNNLNNDNVCNDLILRLNSFMIILNNYKIIYISLQDLSIRNVELFIFRNNLIIHLDFFLKVQHPSFFFFFLFFLFFKSVKSVYPDSKCSYLSHIIIF